ncbi:hypothetical protein BP5796_09998 [Coleophoma crateriformis]|uniref:Uncharacterized protein n=1 Tax=Coleophoma crateriformis TaxID=565419 RepID=A0A3D8QTY7_9HELO|nr:hypothetical protein BP5796_09998 [Coleophoma crateriformis]
MRYSYTFAALLAATSVTALPLNINLGAYSPALVVGDGEISFGAGTDVTNLMTTLSGASASGATTGTGTGTGTAAGPSASASAKPAAASAAPAASSSAATVAAAAVDPSQQMGMGKAIAPREPEAAVDESTAAANLKRDLTGFNAALNFAAGALATSPEVQLGTGEGGSGVGITVKAGASSGKAAGAAGAAAAKRDENSSLPTVTMLKIRTLGGSVQNSKRQTLDTRSVDTSPAAAGPDAIDQVNLNLGSGQDYEMTITEIKP